MDLSPVIVTPAIYYGRSALAASKKRPAVQIAQREPHLPSCQATEAKRLKIEATPSGESAHHSRCEVGHASKLDDADHHVPTQIYEDLPLTEEAQASMTQQIEDLERYILFSQQILRGLNHEGSDILRSSPTLQRDIEVVLQSPTIVDVMISVVGSTGVGKSTLIAALFDMENITQSSGLGKAVTSTIIVFGENKDTTCECKAVFQFISEDQFRYTIGSVYESFAEGNAQLEAENSSLDMVVAYCGKSAHELRAFMPENQRQRESNEADQSLFTDKVLASGPRKLLGQKHEFRYDTWQQMRDDVRQKVSASPQNKLVWWPILSTVRLLIKHPLVKRGLKLTDTPGLGDANTARSQMALSAITDCNAFVLAVPAVRANSVKEHLDTVKRAVARVHQEGRLHTIIVACTQADQMDVEQTATDLNSSDLADLKSHLTQASERLAELQHCIPEEQREYEDKKRLIEGCKKDIKKWEKQLENVKIGKKITIPRDQAIKVNFDRPLDQVRIEDVLGELKTIKDQHEGRVKSLSEQLPIQKAETEELTKTIGILDLNFNRRTFQARNRHIADEQVDLLIKTIKEQERHSATEMARITGKTFTSNLNDPEYWAKLRQQLYPSMIAAKAHLNLSNPKSGTKGVIKSREMTGIDSLALKLKGVNLVEQFRHIRSLKIKTDLVLNVLKDATSDRTTGSSLAGSALISQSMYSDRITFLPQMMGNIVQNGRIAVDRAFKLEYIDYEGELTAHSLSRATQRMDLYAAPPKLKPDKSRDKGLYVAEIRAGCSPSRGGIWDGRSTFFDFNDTVAAPIRMYTSSRMVHIFTTAVNGLGSRKTAHALLRCQDELVDVINQRHREFQKLACEIQMNAQTLAYLDRQVALRKTDIVSMVRQAMRDMADVHVNAATSIAADIRSAYVAGYDRAYHLTQSGKGSKRRATNALESALSEDAIVEGAMDKLKQRVQKNYGTVMVSFSQQVTRAAESMRQDYSQTLQQQEAGFLKIANSKVAKGLQHGLLALENGALREGYVEMTDEEDDDDIEMKAEYAENDPDDFLDYA